MKKAFHYFMTELEIVYRFIYIKNKLKGNFESGIFMKVHFEFQFLSKEI